ncbi:MAG: Hsp70 family protein [Bdellovibrionales bacterium]|nr:Hsp70 family protein [Bdellovibrionales bacterium]
MIYAIDFGTSNSLLGAAESSRLHSPIPLDPHARDASIFRSVMFFPDGRSCFYGAEAVQEFVKHGMEGRLIRSIKKFLPVRSFVGTYIDERPMNLEDIIAVFLGEMRRRANEHFQRDVDSVVLGRPAKFSSLDDEDRFAEYRLDRAARIAGFKNIEFCPEPVAAAYEFKQQLEVERTVLVADFGGGTSDFTVIRMGKENFRPSDVLAVGGVAVAGDALDGAVMRRRIARHFGAGVKYKVPFGSNVLTMPIHLMEKICSPADISLLRAKDTLEFLKNVRSGSLSESDKRQMDCLFLLINEQLGFELFEEIERTKRMLSEREMEKFAFTKLEIDIHETISRAEFEDYTEDAVHRILRSLDQTIQDAGIKHGDVDLICSTGGTAKVGVLQRALETRFGPEKVREHRRFHSVVEGLSHRAQETLRA